METCTTYAYIVQRKAYSTNVLIKGTVDIILSDPSIRGMSDSNNLYNLSINNVTILKISSIVSEA